MIQHTTHTFMMVLQALSLFCAFVLSTGCKCGSELPPPAATVAVARLIRGEMTVTRAGYEKSIEGMTRVEREATVSTGNTGRGTVRLDSGAFILLDRSTAIGVALAQATLERGRLWVDASNSEETTITTPQGSMAASAATMAVSLADGETTVYCGSGEITYRTEQGNGLLSQGEQVVLTGSQAPRPEGADLWDDWTGGLAEPTPRRFQQPTAVGRLAGRQLTDLGRARLPLPVRGHEVRVQINGDLATTEVIQTFFNARSDQLETEYTIRLPEKAIVSEFAVDTGRGFQDSAINAWSIASGYELAWVASHTPTSALSYDGPGRLRARIYPIEAGATVRVRLRYTEWLERRDDMRTYVYPMGTGGDPPLLGEFTLEVNLSNAEASAVRAGMGAQVESRRIVLRRSDFRPRTDFYLDLIKRDEEGGGIHEDRALAYVVDAPREAGSNNPAEGMEQYVLFDIPTPRPSESDSQPPLELVLLVDVSGATDSEDLELARTAVEAILRQLTPTDRVALLLGDVTAHAPSGVEAGLRQADANEREAILESLSRAELGGATNLGQSLRDAAALVSGRPRGAVLYLGDGHPTTGPLDATALRETLATITAPPRFFAFAIGDGSNLGLLQALFGEQAMAVRNRNEASQSVMSTLAEAARPTLRGVTVDLGATVERVYARPPITVTAGSHLRLVGRLRSQLPPEITLTGQVDGETVEQRYAVQEEEIDDRGDIRRRWAAHRLEELLDEDAGREALIELGVRFDIVTPWTSFVVNSVKGRQCSPIEGFDRDPLAFAWSRGGGGETGGWRRRARRISEGPASLPETTWINRVGPPPALSARGRTSDLRNAAAVDEALARAAVQRALQLSERGPRGCYERRLLVRPDLSGWVQVTVDVESSGVVRQGTVTRSTLHDPDCERCIARELRGIRLPSSAINRAVTVSHNYNFEVSSREIGVRRSCSDASRQDLEIRRALWRERLAANSGLGGALTVWREAGANCELSNWRARRTLLNMMLNHVGGVAGQVRLYQAFGPSSPVAAYLVRAIIRRVRTPDDVDIVRAGLGIDVPVDWGYFTTLWYRNESAEARLRLVRRWLEALPQEMDLRLRLLSLLEQTGALNEARRLAHELRGDPLADARVRTAVGEFWLRQENESEARRVLSEIVEYAPLDPWARSRLGDLYRAHEWHNDAYREYLTLARLRPDDPSVMLHLARAAAGAGRTDEALRLEQELSESLPPSVFQGTAAFARLWSNVRLSRLKVEMEDEAMRTAISRRERASGALRDPPALFAALTWEHPDDRPQLWLRYPNLDDDEWEQVPLRGDLFGIEAVRIREREEGDHYFEVRRLERDEIRDIEARLLVVIAPGTGDERSIQETIRLTREERTLRFRLTPENTLETVSLRR